MSRLSKKYKKRIRKFRSAQVKADKAYQRMLKVYRKMVE